MELAIVFAIIAMVFWGFGDYLIERATKKVGDLITLSFIGLFGAIILAPKAIPLLFHISGFDYLILTILGLLQFAFGIVLFEAYRRGKLSVVEVLLQLELPMTIVFAVTLLKESVRFSTIILVIMILLGTLLLSKVFAIRKSHFEKGWWLAIVAAVISAIASTMTAFVARDISPLLSIWFPWTIIGVLPMIFLWKEYDHILAKCMTVKGTLLGAAAFDTGAWLAYAYALQGTNLSLVAGIAAGYCAIAAVLGFWLNNERLTKWQTIGAIITIAASIILATLISS